MSGLWFWRQSSLGIGCDACPVSGAATGVGLPSAIDTSIWRSSVTICSALNLFFGMAKLLSKLILSQRLVQKS